MRPHENPEKSISDQLDAALAQLSTERIRFVIARQECKSDKDAAEAIGIKPDTVYHWPEIVRDAVRHMAADGLTTALHMRRRHLAKAMAVKVAGLDSNNERLRQSVATELIEWEMGKATQPTEERAEAAEGLTELLMAARDSLAQQQDDETDDPDTIYERFYGAEAGSGAG